MLYRWHLSEFQSTAECTFESDNSGGWLHKPTEDSARADLYDIELHTGQNRTVQEHINSTEWCTCVK